MEQALYWLTQAAEQGLIPANPADEVEPPKVIRQPMNILNADQLDTFMDTIKADSTWYDFFYTELTTGLRLGKICGLMWTDFDSRAGVLHICRTLHREKGGRLVAGDTKTYAGTRKIVLPPSTAELLTVQKKASFSPCIFHNLLHPEAPVNPGCAYRQLKKLLAQAKLPNIRFHDLRHTYASLMIADGVPLVVVSRQLGHAQASTTANIYAHAIASAQAKAMQPFDRFNHIVGTEKPPEKGIKKAAGD